MNKDYRDIDNALNQIDKSLTDIGEVWDMVNRRILNIGDEQIYRVYRRKLDTVYNRIEGFLIAD